VSETTFLRPKVLRTKQRLKKVKKIMLMNMMSINPILSSFYMQCLTVTLNRVLAS